MGTDGCAALGESCANNLDCCSNRCTDMLCAAGDGGCGQGGAICDGDFACCSGSCLNGFCEGAGPTCHATGDACTSDPECCSGRCESMRCARLPLCRASGEPCTFSSQCCSGDCGSGGYCRPIRWCKVAFEPCGTATDCCSGRWRLIDGFRSCEPLGGCSSSGPVLNQKGDVSLWGELCESNGDCCSNLCTPDTGNVRRCQKGGNPTCGPADQVKLPLGERCNTDCECLSNLCVEPRAADGSGAFPKRCVSPTFPTCRSDGDVCGDPGECCEPACVRWPDGVFRCAFPPATPEGCFAAGESCTRGADCCSPLTCGPFGSQLICQPP
jgi:hypothetical protein